MLQCHVHSVIAVKYFCVIVCLLMQEIYKGSHDSGNYYCNLGVFAFQVSCYKLRFIVNGFCYMVMMIYLCPLFKFCLVEIHIYSRC